MGKLEMVAFECGFSRTSGWVWVWKNSNPAISIMHDHEVAVAVKKPRINIIVKSAVWLA